MDPSIIGKVDSLFALLGLGIVAITVLILDQRRRQGQAAESRGTEGERGISNNGHSVSANYVKRVVAENCRDCPRVETVEKRLDRMTERLDQIYQLLVERV